MSDREWNIGINFLSFVMLADSFKTFSSFDKGISDGSLTFTELRFEANQQRLPNIFTPSIIEIFERFLRYQLSLSFPQFLTLNLYTKIFISYASNDKFEQIYKLDRINFNALLKDRNTPKAMRIMIDNVFTDIPMP